MTIKTFTTRDLCVLAFLAAAATCRPASADTVFYNYTGSVQYFSVPFDGDYEINAGGAQGGSDQDSYGGRSYRVGGRGAVVGGDFELFAGQVLLLYVGQQGGSAGFGINTGGGGGGRTLVSLNGVINLLIAGGGGGVGSYSDQYSGIPLLYSAFYKAVPSLLIFRAFFAGNSKKPDKSWQKL